MTEEQYSSILSLLRGIYRRPGEVRALRQPPLPGLAPDDTRNDAPDGCEWTMPRPGEIAKRLPRRWCNTVRAYEALWDQAVGAIPFEVAELYKPTVLDVVAERTSRRLKPQTLARMRERARAVFHERFTGEIFARNVERVYLKAWEEAGHGK